MSKNFDIFGELKEIGKIISSASTLMAVRQEISKIARDGVVVTDGKHHTAGNGYEVVVSCNGAQDSVARRLRASIPDIKVDKIATGVLGIRTARRVKKVE